MIADLFRDRGRAKNGPRNATVINPASIVYNGNSGTPSAEQAKRLSAVFAAVDIRAGSMSVLPAYVMDTRTRERVPHKILDLLSSRPNEAMTASVRKRILETSILLEGNAYDWIVRDPVSHEIRELIPIPGNLVEVWLDSNLRPWYDVQHPQTGAIMRLSNEDVCHYKGPSRSGFTGESVLTYAQQTIRAGLAAGEYNTRFYESGGQPSGILTVDADLSGYVRGADGKPTEKTKKDYIREQWESVHSGADNSHRIAVLDLGMKYQALSISQSDAQFIEQQNLTVIDIARFFGVPAYKLQAGNQSYNANEQQSLEYLAGLQPRVTQMEEEQTYKLLSGRDLQNGLEIRYNMDAILRSNSASRASYYKTLWEIGAMSDNEIRDKEDLPDIEGGDEHMASLNYVPLSIWRELSINRNSGGGENK